MQFSKKVLLDRICKSLTKSESKRMDMTGALEPLELKVKEMFMMVMVVITMMVMVMVTQHIPIMTKSHLGGEMSVMIKVGMCQCQKPTIHHTP